MPATAFAAGLGKLLLFGAKAGTFIGAGYGFHSLAMRAESNALAMYGPERSERMFGSGFETLSTAGFALGGAAVLTGALGYASFIKRSFAGAAGSAKIRSRNALVRAKNSQTSFAGRSARFLGRNLRRASPYLAAGGAGAMASSSIYRPGVAEGNIIALGREPAYERMNFRTAGITLR